MNTTRICSFIILTVLTQELATTQITFTDVSDSAAPGLGDGTARGIAWVDFNNDGLPDLFVPTAGNTPNKLYKNLGNGTFIEVAAQVGLNDLSNTITCSWGDFDNDGDVDLVVTTTGGPTKLWRNNLLTGGDTTFTDISTGAGISLNGAQMPSWADYNHDGFADFYVPVASTTVADALYRNNQNATFTNVADSAGVNHQVSGISEQAIHWGDYDSDGLADLFIGSLSGQSFFHRNNGNGTFTEIAASLGFQGTARGAQWVDYNNDGLWDLSVAGYAGTTTIPIKLFRNNGDGTFTDVAATAGITDPVISWGVSWADFDNNGYEDCFVTVSGQSTNCILYKNNGNGTFTNVTAQAGLSGLVQLCAVWGDYNNDGFMDLYTSGAPSAGNHLFRNNGDPTKRWLKVNLVGTQSNRAGIGAQIIIVAGNLRMMREVNTGAGYRSQNMLTAHFGLDTNTTADSVIVRWPSGIVTIRTNVGANQTLTIVEQHVTAPNIVLYPDTLTLTWANVFRDTLWVKNTGDALLIVDTIYASPNDSLEKRLRIQPRSFTVVPGDSQLVNVWEWSIIPLSGVRPQYEFVESLFVVSNDPDDSILTVILRGDYSPTNAVEDRGEPPVHYALAQNYPNPFNPTTKIEIRIAEPGLVTLKVYNVLGQEVATLINAVKQPGTYEVTWDVSHKDGRQASGFPSGVYFYRMTAQPDRVGARTFVETKKLLLLR